MSEKTTAKRKRTQFSCFICGKDNESVSYFKFPKNETRSAWLSFVNLPADFDDVNLHLCSKHFSEDVLKKEANRYTLRVNAVPSLLQSVSKKLRLKYNRCTLCTGQHLEDEFFSFPSDEELKEKWVNFCGMSMKQVSKTTFLCHRHFEDNDFTEKVWMKDKPMKILKPDAVPSIHTEFEERKKPKKPNYVRTHCRLCDYSGNDTNYFKFPKNAEQNSEWRRICRLDDLIDTKKMVLCGKHFSDDQKVFRAKRTYLKPLAVPTLDINHIHESNLNSVPSECISRTSESSMTKEMNARAEPCEISSEPTSSFSGTPRNDQSLNVTLLSTPTCSQSVEPSDFSFAKSPSINAQMFNKDLTPTVVQQSPQRRKLRFFGDVKTPDLATPRRARLCWNIAKKTMHQKDLKIRSYQEKISRLQKRIQDLSDLTDHLQAEKFIPEHAAKLLTVIH